MLDVAPVFVSSPIPEAKPPKKTPASRERRGKPKKPTATKTSPSRSEINKTLASLYSSNRAEDIQTIEIKKSSSTDDTKKR